MSHLQKMCSYSEQKWPEKIQLPLVKFINSCQAHQTWTHKCSQSLCKLHAVFMLITWPFWGYKTGNFLGWLFGCKRSNLYTSKYGISIYLSIFSVNSLFLSKMDLIMPTLKGAMISLDKSVQKSWTDSSAIIIIIIRKHWDVSFRY